MPAVRSGSPAFTAGQFPLVDGVLAAAGSYRWARQIERIVHRSLLQPLVRCDGVDPLRPGKPGEIGIRRVDGEAVLDCHGRQLSIGHQVTPNLVLAEQPEQDSVYPVLGSGIHTGRATSQSATRSAAVCGSNGCCQARGFVLIRGKAVSVCHGSATRCAPLSTDSSQSWRLDETR